MKITEKYKLNFNEIVKDLSLEIDNCKCNLKQNSFLKKNYKGFDLSEKEMKIINSLFGNFSIYWEYQMEDDDYEIGGEINYLKPSKMKLSDSVSYIENKELVDLVIFENRIITGDGILVGFLPKRNNEIWIIDFNGNAFRLKLGLLDYLEKNIDLRGYIYWQFLYSNIDIQDDYFTFIKSRIIKLFEDLPKIFPDINIEKYSVEYRSINGNLRDLKLS